MLSSKIDSFVSKFKHLLHAGLVASLKIDAQAGEANVVLQANLGNVLSVSSLPNTCPSRNLGTSFGVRSPSYQRRQDRHHRALNKCDKCKVF